MPPLSQRQAKLSKAGQKPGKPFVIYLASSLFVILALYGNLVLRTLRRHEAANAAASVKPTQPLATTAKQINSLQLNSLTRTLEDDKQKSQAHAIEDVVTAMGNEMTSLEIFSEAACKGTPSGQATAGSSEPVHLEPDIFPKSVRLHGSGLAKVFVGIPSEYKGTVMEVEGCVDFYDLFKDDQKKIKFTVFSSSNKREVITAVRQIDPRIQRQFATAPDIYQPHTRFVFSSESSEYFGYQLYAGALGFLRSKQTEASWLRLLSSAVTDDLSEKFPTFTAPKSLYANFYHPINKADVIDKWMHSPDAPHPDDTIVVIDPDNWLINDIHPWASRATRKGALGQEAYYVQNPMLQDLWQESCLNNCHLKTDPAAVPYVLKASDLKDVAPLWRSYSIGIKERFKTNTTFKEKYGPGLGVRWAAEMFGYNFACTHLGIQTEIVSDMQKRDVDGGKRQFAQLDGKMPMIHMGRAWFPANKPELAAPWRHSADNEPSDIRGWGIQVWCKCNDTAADIQPWPLPEGLDWVSRHTLTLLHDSIETFGPIPVNDTFRKHKRPALHGWSHP
jgi:hypothetical protein